MAFIPVMWLQTKMPVLSLLLLLAQITQVLSFTSSSRISLPSIQIPPIFATRTFRWSTSSSSSSSSAALCVKDTGNSDIDDSVDIDSNPNNLSIQEQIESVVAAFSPDDQERDPSCQPLHHDNSDSISNCKVFIIGTGLSNCALDLPLSTLSILVRADVVLHDALSLPESEIRRMVPAHCIVQSVGKRGDDKQSYTQADIDTLLIKYATSPSSSPSAGTSTLTSTANNTNQTKTTVVRLKGGDPFLFGRSRTEIDSLRDNSVPYQVIPNLSSCVAGPHYGGIPLTDPLLNAQSFAVFSGTNEKGIGAGADNTSNNNKRDWETMNVDTLVFLMIGRLDKLEALCQRIAGSDNNSNGEDARWDQQTHCAIVQNAGRSQQRVWRATLGTLVDTIRGDIGDTTVTVSPAILIVGRTASLDLLAQ